MELSIEQWDRARSSEREAISRRLAMQLPAGFTFEGIRAYGRDEQPHEVALYRNDAVLFALVPGGAVRVGYDADRPWEPKPDELESWQGTSEEYGIANTIQEYIAEVTLRVRLVELSPFLIETTPVELGWEAIELDDPEVQGILGRYQPGKTVGVCRGDVRTRVRTGSESSVIAERALSETHEQLAAQLSAAGFRFPTSDEWEYCCGRGKPTLFRWGDHVPCDRYPTDVSPAEAAWRRQWALSAGRLEYPAEGFTSDWDHHRRPNGFGLLIASDPYKYELMSEAGITRGGDGGCYICGGAGFFISWLTLATAYFDKQLCKYDPSEPISHGYTYGRRVVELR